MFRPYQLQYIWSCRFTLQFHFNKYSNMIWKQLLLIKSSPLFFTFPARINKSASTKLKTWQEGFSWQRSTIEEAETKIHQKQATPKRSLLQNLLVVITAKAINVIKDSKAKPTRINKTGAGTFRHLIPSQGPLPQPVRWFHQRFSFGTFPPRKNSSRKYR